MALKEYYEGVVQYEEFLDSKLQSRKSLADEIKKCNVSGKDKEKDKKTSKEGPALK